MSGNPDQNQEVQSAFLAQARERLTTSCDLIRHCVGQLSVEQLWWRPRDAQNSIANLVLHVTGNLRERIVALVGGQASARDRAREFSMRGGIDGDELLRRLDSTVKECDAVLAALPAARLLEPRSYRGISRQFDLNVLSVIFQTLLHLAGHTQEIVFMTRLQLGDAYRFANPPPQPQ